MPRHFPKEIVAVPISRDELCSVFSPEAIRKGSFDKYVLDTKVRKGTAEVDDAFLAQIEDWRDSLARNIALRNPRLGTPDNTADLNLAVQMTIDRAIFLRICEDRGIEDYGTLQNLIGKPGLYRRLMERFEDADKRYNSGLFDFRKDTVTPSLKIDDKLLSDILSELYPPKSPYEFSVIGIEILGEVYEQFLGKVIRLTAGHQAKVEEKPEGLVPARAFDRSSVPRKLSAMPSELSPALTDMSKRVSVPGNPWIPPVSVETG